MTPTPNTTGVINGLEPAVQNAPVAPAKVSTSGIPNPPSSAAPKAPRKDPGNAPDGTPRPTGLDYRMLVVKLGFDSTEVMGLKGLGLSPEEIFDGQHPAAKPTAPVAQPQRPTAAPAAPKPAPAYVPQASETPAQELARLRSENAALKAGTIGKVTFAVSEGGNYKDSRTGEDKTSEGGNMVIRGLSGKYGITLYKQAAFWIFGNPTVNGDMGHVADIRTWLKANHSLLRDKPVK